MLDDKLTTYFEQAIDKKLKEAFSGNAAVAYMMMYNHGSPHAGGGKIFVFKRPSVFTAAEGQRPSYSYLRVSSKAVTVNGKADGEGTPLSTDDHLKGHDKTVELLKAAYPKGKNALLKILQTDLGPTPKHLPQYMWTFDNISPAVAIKEK